MGPQFNKCKKKMVNRKMKYAGIVHWKEQIDSCCYVAARVAREKGGQPGALPTAKQEGRVSLLILA